MPDIQVVQITLQALASFAIGGGLQYTAIQFRQARKAQLVTNFSKLVELQYAAEASTRGPGGCGRSGARSRSSACSAIRR